MQQYGGHIKTFHWFDFLIHIHDFLQTCAQTEFLKSSEDLVSFLPFEGKFLDWERQETLRDDFYTLQRSQNGEFLIFRVFLCNFKEKFACNGLTRVRW